MAKATIENLDGMIASKPGEEWRDIEEFKGFYQVSNFGRVKKLARFAYTRTYPEQIMKNLISKNCVIVLLSNGTGAQFQRSVAKLVLLAFVGDPPQDARQTRHKDGNPANNCLSNLEWAVCKGYGAPESPEAQQLFYRYGEKFVDFCIKKHGYYRALKRVGYDVEDFRQLCLWKIWKYINIFKPAENGHGFLTFCETKCRDVFCSVYRKYRKKSGLFIFYEDMAMENRPIDHIAALGYEPDFDK